MSNTSSAVGCLVGEDAAFGPVVQSCRDGFDFTLAFEQYWFSILPASILLVVAPLRIRHLITLPTASSRHSLQRAKLVAIAIFSALQLTLVILWATQSEVLGRVRNICTAASCLSFVASLVVCGLSYVEDARSLRPSVILNAYLLISLLLDAAVLRTFWLTELPGTIQAVFTAAFAVKTTLLILEARERADPSDGEGGPRNPEATSGIYNQGFFWWLNPLLMDGFRRLLKPADLYGLDESMATATLNESFWRTWNTTTSTHEHRLLWICVKTLRWPLAAVVLPRLCLLAFTICQPLVLTRFLTFLQNSTEGANVGYSLIGAYGLVYLGIALSSSFYNHRSFRSVTMLRGMLISAVFAKSTEIPTATDNSASVTLMSTDVDQIIRAFKQIHEFWANTIQIGLATWLLSSQIGFAAAGPVAVCAISLGLTIVVSPKAQGTMVAWVEQVQKRIGTTSTMLGHMKSVKMSGLSGMFYNTIAHLRIEEMQAASPFRIISSVTSGIAQIPLLISPVAAFALFTISALKTGQTLDATRMFSSLSLIMLLGQPLFWMFETVLDMNAALGCFKRIEKFLSGPGRMGARLFNTGSAAAPSPDPGASAAQLSPSNLGIELQNLGHGSRDTTDDASLAPVEVRKASFSWSAGTRPILDEITFSVKKGQLAMLVGPIASGKSTLLKGLLGEVPETTGEVAVLPLSLSWCEQTPWLMNDTIRKNIVGFSEMDDEFYNRVVHACDLNKDFAQLSNGDETLVGSKGMALSGGQKQRVAIARAAYARPQLALFDDVLSGLDNQTAQTIFTRLFGESEGLFRSWGATVILATHSMNFLPSSDLVLALDKGGRLVGQGRFSNLMKSGGYVRALYGEQQHDHNGRGETSDEGAATERKAKVPAAAAADDRRRQVGDVTVYRYFFGNVGLLTTVGFLAIEVSWAFLATFPTVWLKWWSDANLEHPNADVAYFLGVYAGLQSLEAVCFFGLVVYGLVVVGVKSGINLHDKLLRAVVTAPLSLFASTDVGSFTTRFSQDIGLLDRNLPLSLLISVANLLTVIGTGALIASATGFIAVSFPFIVAVFYYLQNAYLRTSRQLRFLDLEQKAPVYTQFLETLGGLPTIRAFSWGRKALELNNQLVDQSQRPFYLLLMIQQWLTLVLDLIVAALAVLIAGLAVRLRGSVSVGLTAVSLVQLITLAEVLKLLIQFWTALETSIGAVARIKNFSEETPDENLPGETHAPPANWPAQGSIEIHGLSASYGEDLDVKALDGVSLSLRAGEKVGICGRTGSGKSSLLLTLLRLLDPTSGTLTIDGLDLSTLPRETVRARLLAVSQDAFALPGSVLHNLDPYAAGAGADAAAAQAALARVGLWEAVRDRGGLGAALAEDALSHGQRQLFALARVLLRRRRGGGPGGPGGGGGGGGGVLLLDEATSGVDAATEAVVREVVREEFAGYTVVAVAHRLESIVGLDRVVVLEKGCVVEDGAPAELFAGGGTGRFRELWEARHRGGQGRAVE